MIHLAVMKVRACRLKTCAVGTLLAGLAVASPLWAGRGAAGPVASSVATPDLPSRESLDVVKKRASEQRKMLVIELGAAWCTPCKQFESEVLPKESVRVALGQVYFVRYDAETEVGKQAARALSVEGYPTFLALRTDGEVASIVQGFQSETEFVHWISQVAPDFEPSAMLDERLKKNPADGEAMLLVALRQRKAGNLQAALGWLEKARVAKTASADSQAKADWELRRLRLRLLLPRQQLVEHLDQFPSGPHKDEALRALLRLGPLDAVAQGAVARYLDRALPTLAPDRLNQLVYRLLRAQAFPEAERVTRHLLSIDPRSPYYLDTLAEIFHLRGDSKEALRLSGQALGQVKGASGEALRQSLLQNQARFARARKEPPAELATPDDELQPWEKD